MSRRTIIALAKALISVLLIVFVATRIDRDSLAGALSGLTPLPVIAATLLLAMQAPIFALRWRKIIALLGGKIGFGPAFRMLLVGLFFNQTLPSSVGGDAVRIWYASRAGLPLRVSMNSVLLERLTGLLALALIMGAALPFAWDTVEDAPTRALLLAVLAASFAGAWLAHQFARLPSTLIARPVLREIAALSTDLRTVAGAIRGLATLMALGAVGGGLAIAAVAILGAAIGVALDPFAYAALVPAVILFTVIPVSLAGWGVREGAMVVLLGAAGVEAEAAFLLSLLFGACLLVAALPGGGVWLFTRAIRGRDAAADSEPDDAG